MIDFNSYFEEKNTPVTYLYHLTNGTNTPSILKGGLNPGLLSNFEDDWDVDNHSTKAYGGIYFGKNLKKLIPTFLDWGSSTPNDVGLIVVQSKGYTQLFMDEDNLINSIPHVDKAVKLPLFKKFVEKGFSELPTLNTFVGDFLKEIKDKFYINQYQKDILKRVILQNYPIIYFRGIERHPDIDPVLWKMFQKKYNINSTEEHFRGVFDKLTKLKLKFKQDPKGFDLDSGRVMKTVGYSGNPKIVGVYRFIDGKPNVMYSRLEQDIEQDILQDAYYTIKEYS